MKQTLLLLVSALLVLQSFSQKDTTLAPYKRFPGFPPISLLLPDGVTSVSYTHLKPYFSGSKSGIQLLSVPS